TSYALLAGGLFVRGLGFGWTLMPAMAAAYRNLSRAAVPRATTVLNIVLRVGGSFGTALAAVVLQRQISARLPHSGGGLLHGGPLPAREPTTAAGRHVYEALASSFAHTFSVLLAITCIGFTAALFLPKGPARAPDQPEPARLS